MAEKIRVRFAPSPTGSLHLGGIRSALFNWLLAKQSKGTFVLRLEDTDRERFNHTSVQQIQESLKWLGLEWDEGIGCGGKFGPYIQSERLEVYQQYASRLIEERKAYRCWCTAKRLDDLRKRASTQHQAFKYDRYCLTHSNDPNKPHVIRFLVPEIGSIGWKDEVKGRLEFKTEDLDDFVMIKSDGFPTYNFANVIDDHLMAISHVLRGDEFVSTTPKNLLVYAAYGWTAPRYAHLPQVLGPDKTKLSKRHGAKSVLEYKADGYLPDAIINFLALLGWNDGTDQEIYDRAELIKKFSLNRVQSSPAIFDTERLNWLNGIYIRELSLDQLTKAAIGFWPTCAQKFDKKYKLAVLKILQERLKNLSELATLSSYFFSEPDIKTVIKYLKIKADQKQLFNYVKLALETIEQTPDLAKSCSNNEKTPEYMPKHELVIEHSLRETYHQHFPKNTSSGAMLAAISIALTGRNEYPQIGQMLAILPKTIILKRLKTVLIALK